jgi:hypothetical protein
MLLSITSSSQTRTSAHFILVSAIAQTRTRWDAPFHHILVTDEDECPFHPRFRYRSNEDEVGSAHFILVSAIAKTRTSWGSYPHFFMIENISQLLSGFEINTIYPAGDFSSPIETYKHPTF